MFDGAVHARLGGLHRIELIMHRRGRTGQIVDLVHFDIQRKSDVVPHQLEARVLEQVLDVGLAAGEEIVDAQYVVPGGKQALAQVRAEKTGSAGDEQLLHLEFSHRRRSPPRSPNHRVGNRQTRPDSARNVAARMIATRRRWSSPDGTLGRRERMLAGTGCAHGPRIALAIGIQGLTGSTR